MNIEEQPQLAALRDRVNILEIQVRTLANQLGITFAAGLGPGDDQQVIELVRKGDKLGAIRVYRATHTAGLAEAQAAVEAAQARLNA